MDLPGESLGVVAYAAGDLRDPEDAYRGFRGRLPEPEALLRQRGLMNDA